MKSRLGDVKLSVKELFESDLKKLEKDCKIIIKMMVKFKDFIEKSINLFNTFITITALQSFHDDSTKDFIPKLRKKRVSYKKKNKVGGLLFSCMIKTNETKMHSNFQDFITEFLFQFQEFRRSQPSLFKDISEIQSFLEKYPKEKILKINELFEKKIKPFFRSTDYRNLRKRIKKNLVSEKSKFLSIKDGYLFIVDILSDFSKLVILFKNNFSNENYRDAVNLYLDFLRISNQFFSKIDDNTNEKFLKKTTKLKEFFDKSQEKLNELSQPPKLFKNIVQRNEVEEIVDVINEKKSLFDFDIIFSNFKELQEVGKSKNLIQDESIDLSFNQFLVKIEKIQKTIVENEKLMNLLVKNLDLLNKSQELIEKTKKEIDVVSVMKEEVESQIKKVVNLNLEDAKEVSL